MLKSLWKRQSCLFAVALASGGAGTLLELQSTLVPPPVRSRTIAVGDFQNVYVEIHENGDGTAATNVGAYISSTEYLGMFLWENTNYAVSANLGPGQSGHGPGSGTGQFTIPDAMAYDFVNNTFVGPFVAHVDLTVAGATSVGALVSQGVVAEHDPITGETRIVRQHIRGNQAWGDTAGSVQVYVDNVLATNVVGTWGQVRLDNTHDVVRLR